MKLKFFILFQLILGISIKVNAQTCKIVEAFLLTGFYNIDNQDNFGFCNEWIIGPILSSKLMLIQFPQVNINCALGDKLTISSGDRSQILYNFCNPVANQVSNYLITEGKYVFLTLLTPSSRPLSVGFAFYFFDTPATTVTTTTTGSTLFPTISTTQKPVITTTTTLTTITTKTTPSVAALNCGNPYIKPNELVRIVGGIEATPNSWPWQAFITDGSSMCGASLIDNNWLVTAAHCLDGINMRTYKAYLGVHNINRMESSTVVVPISKAIKHEKYIGQRNSWDNDIALLKLATPVQYNNVISPVCLPQQGENLATQGSTPFVTGWGKISGFGPTSDVLRQATLTVKTLSFCGANSDNMICAGRSSPVSDSCGGDSGGPSVLKSNGLYYLTGIVSWGSADCTGDGVYTKVSNYVSWIRNTMNAN